MQIDSQRRADRLGPATEQLETPVRSVRVPRVLVVCSGAYPPDFGGGPLTVHKSVVRMRRRFALEAEALALSGPSQQPEWSAVDGITVRRLPASSAALSFAAVIGAHLLRARRQGTNLVYAIHTGRVVYLTAVWAKIFGLPLAIEITNCNLYEKTSRQLIAGWLTRGAALNVAISEPVADELRRLGVDESRLWVRPNPIDIELHRLPSSDERAAQRNHLGYDDCAILHLVAGCIQPRKNQLFAVDVLERLGSEHRLLMVGPVLPDDASFAEELRARVAGSSARDRIQVVEGFTDDLPRIMQAADSLWMPSKEEGLGNVMLEAQCCGVPCIINQALGMDEHVTNGINGWQAPLDAAAWSEAVGNILPLIGDPSKRRAISDDARDRYDAAKFDAQFYRRIAALARRDK